MNDFRVNRTERAPANAGTFGVADGTIPVPASPKGWRKCGSAARILTLLIGVACQANAASLVGELIRFQCPECFPHIDRVFQVLENGLEFAPYGQFAIDVDASTVRISWQIDCIDDCSLANPGYFLFSELPENFVSAATLDPSSTWIPSGLDFTPSSIAIDIGGTKVHNGDFALVILNGVPEPSTVSMVLLAAGVLVGWRHYRRRRLGT